MPIVEYLFVCLSFSEVVESNGVEVALLFVCGVSVCGDSVVQLCGFWVPGS